MNVAIDAGNAPASGNIRMSQAEVPISRSSVELAHLVDVDRDLAAIDRHHEAEADADLAGRDDHHDDRKDLAVAVAPHAGEGDQRDVRRVEHQLEAEQDHERVAAHEHATGADREDQRADHEVPADVHQPPLPWPAGCLGSASPRLSVPSLCARGSPPTPSAIVPVPSGRLKSRTESVPSSSPWMPPRRRARTTAPTAAISSRNDATSKGSRNFVSSSSPICSGVPKPGR